VVRAEVAESKRRARLDAPHDGVPISAPTPVAGDAPAIDRIAAFLGQPIETNPSEAWP